MKFYYDGTNKHWLLNGTPIRPSNTTQRIDGSRIKLTSVEGNVVLYDGLISGLYKSSGVSYGDAATLLGECADFFAETINNDGVITAVQANTTALQASILSASKANNISATAQFKSPFDFNATYTSAASITLTGLPFTIVDSSQIVYIKVVPVTGDTCIIANGANGVTMRVSSGVITVSGSTCVFAATDVYEVGINAQAKAFDPSTNSEMSTVLNPDSERYVQDSLLDTTNIAAATNYYPSATGISMDGFKDMSLTGKFIDADGTMTMTIEATNDEDTTNADWIQIYGWDTKNNAMVNSWTVTNDTLTFAIDYDNLNYSFFRVKMINDGATNTGIIKLRRKAL